MQAKNYNELTLSERRKCRQEYIVFQNNKCHYCKEDLNSAPADVVLIRRVNPNLFPVGFFDWPVHLHHDHNTGLTIGAVHAYCNAVLWQYEGE